MTREVIALVLTVGVHILGAGVLIGVIARNSGADLWGWWPRDDDGREPEAPRPPDPVQPDGGLPLPSAVPAAVRLREPARLADGYGRPARRPRHPAEPVRAPVRERERQ
ncbi:MAG TPA: hypothetical protein VIL49_16085 [Capillimicrobium sp.]